MEAGVQINDLEHKEEINQPEQNEEIRIQKNKEKIRRLGHFQNYQHLNHRVARGEEEEQEIKNLLEKIMKETCLDWRGK